MKHQLTGGWYYDKRDTTWKQAGLGVRNTIIKQPMLRRLIGWSFEENSVVGTSQISAPSSSLADYAHHIAYSFERIM